MTMTITNFEVVKRIDIDNLRVKVSFDFDGVEMIDEGLYIIGSNSYFPALDMESEEDLFYKLQEAVENR